MGFLDYAVTLRFAQNDRSKSADASFACRMSVDGTPTLHNKPTRFGQALSPASYDFQRQ
jgi:hypothetical protein